MFPTTRRSVIAALASDDDEQRRRAFDTFVALYWKPLYKSRASALRKSFAWSQPEASAGA